MLDSTNLKLPKDSSLMVIWFSGPLCFNKGWSKLPLFLHLTLNKAYVNFFFSFPSLPIFHLDVSEPGLVTWFWRRAASFVGSFDLKSLNLGLCLDSLTQFLWFIRKNTSLFLTAPIQVAIIFPILEAVRQSLHISFLGWNIYWVMNMI